MIPDYNRLLLLTLLETGVSTDNPFTNWVEPRSIGELCEFPRGYPEDFMGISLVT